MNLKKSLVFLAVVFSLNVATAQGQETGSRDEANLRLLIHAHRGGSEQGWSPVAWALAPAINKSAETWVVLAGARYDGKVDEKSGKTRWSIELLGGALFSPVGETSLFDVRVTPPKSGRWSSWVNARWIDPFGANNGYLYAMLDYTIPQAKIKIGIETENVFLNGRLDNLSIGPHIIKSITKELAVVVAHQFHTTGPDQTWVRLKLTF